MQRIQSAKTVEDAKELVMKDLHLDEFDSYELEILDEPSKGFLGIGSKEARVKLVVKTDKVAKANHLVKEMIQMLGYKPEFKHSLKEEDNQLVIHFSGDESSNFRGGLGRSMHKLEFLLNNMVNRKDRDGYLKAVFEFDGEEPEERKKSRTDRKSPRKPSAQRDQNSSEEGEGRRPRRSDSRGSGRDRGGRNADRPPRQNRNSSGDRNSPRGDFQRGEGKPNGSFSKPHRERFLVSMAKKMAQQVLDTKKTVHLNPMNSYDRRIIHTELNEMDHISTSSDGEGDRRHVVIQYQE